MPDLLEFALDLAAEAEAAIMPVFRSCSVNLKADGSEVTDADRLAEEVMRKRISKGLPSHRILGEEFGGPQEPTNEPVWILDPIDGTASFVLGLPVFGTLIGYAEGGEAQLGVMHFPAMAETVYAVKGSGCWWQLRGHDPEKIVTTKTSVLSDAYISACSTRSPHKLGALIRKSGRFRFISDCVQHALVAQGRVDAAIDTVMNPWDICAIVPCIEEAGGVTSDIEGRRDHIVWRRSLVSTANSALHEEVLRALQGTEVNGLP
jgi:histidinol-phosphatase